MNLNRMKVHSKVKNVLFALVLNTMTLYASENIYEKLAIIAEVPEEAKNKIYHASITKNKNDMINNLLSSEKGERFIRMPSASYHISLACFNYDYPENSNLHVKFNANYANMLGDFMNDFAENKSSESQGGYKDAEAYDMQLWCHKKVPGQNNQHYYFNNHKTNIHTGVRNIEELNSLTDVDFAHIILRIGTRGKDQSKVGLVGDWDNLVRNSNVNLLALDAPDLMPYFVGGELALRTHITVGRVEKKINNVHGSFQGDNDLDRIKLIYQVASQGFQPVKFDIDTIAVATRDMANNGKIKTLKQTKL